MWEKTGKRKEEEFSKKDFAERIGDWIQRFLTHGFFCLTNEREVTCRKKMLLKLYFKNFAKYVTSFKRTFVFFPSHFSSEEYRHAIIDPQRKKKEEDPSWEKNLVVVIIGIRLSHNKTTGSKSEHPPPPPPPPPPPLVYPRH